MSLDEMTMGALTRELAMLADVVAAQVAHFTRETGLEIDVINVIYRSMENGGEITEVLVRPVISLGAIGGRPLSVNASRRVES